MEVNETKTVHIKQVSEHCCNKLQDFIAMHLQTLHTYIILLSHSEFYFFASISKWKKNTLIILFQRHNFILFLRLFTCLSFSCFTLHFYFFFVSLVTQMSTSLLFVFVFPFLYFHIVNTILCAVRVCKPCEYLNT